MPRLVHRLQAVSKRRKQRTHQQDGHCRSLIIASQHSVRLPQTQNVAVIEITPASRQQVTRNRRLPFWESQAGRR